MTFHLRRVMTELLNPLAKVEKVSSRLQKRVSRVLAERTHAEEKERSGRGEQDDVRDRGEGALGLIPEQAGLGSAGTGYQGQPAQYQKDNRNREQCRCGFFSAHL